MTNVNRVETAPDAAAGQRRRPPWEEELLMSGKVNVGPSLPVAAERSTFAILAALKPNDPGDAVLGVAQWLAEHEHRALHVVSVVDTAPLVSSIAAGAPYLPPFHDEEGRRAIKRRIREAYHRSGHSAPRFRVDVIEGPAPDTVAEVAREQEASLVVVGKGTHGRLSHMLFGEQVLEIIRRSRSPVLVVPPDAFVPVERAMVAFDFSMGSIRAVVAAHEMLGAGGHLTIVHVATPDRGAGHRSQWWLRSAERRTHETLRDFARSLPRRAGVAVDTEQIHGDAADALAAYARSHEMQLLACGWHGHALPGRIFTTSTTVELLHRAPCAVLVAPEPRPGEWEVGR
jgi:nucleotide-binding universal stress UspA family protein